MAGYRRPKITYTLEFDAPDMVGCEVVCNSMTIDEQIELKRLLLGAEETDESTDKFVTTLVHYLKSWNLEDDNGAPIPLTPSDLRKQDAVFVRHITLAVFAATSGPDSDLKEDSSSGNTSPVQNLPMEAL